MKCPEACPQGYKRCSRCGECKPATPEYFNYANKAKGLFQSRCRVCTTEIQTIARRKKGMGFKTKYPIVNGMKQCRICKQWKPATNEYFDFVSLKKATLRSDCKACRQQQHMEHPDIANERAKRWRDANREEINARRRFGWNDEKRAVKKNWEEKNHDKVLVYRRNDYYRHRDTILHKQKEDRRRKPQEYKAKNKASYQRNKPLFKFHARMSKLRRRARNLNLPDTLTAAQWERAIEYFNGCCAVCGRQLRDLFSTHTVAADHWIPLTDPRPDNPGTVASNIIPLCHGEDGCNNSKGNKDPLEWLTERYGKRKAKTILARIEAYFRWVREQSDS